MLNLSYLVIVHTGIILNLNILIHIIIFVIAIVVAIISIVIWYVDHRKGYYMDEEGTLVFGIVLLICWGVILYCSAGFLAIFLNLSELWEGIFLGIGIFGSFFVFYIYARLKKLRRPRRMTYAEYKQKLRKQRRELKKSLKSECPKCGSLLMSRRHISGLSTSPSIIKKTCRKCGYELDRKIERNHK